MELSKLFDLELGSDLKSIGLQTSVEDHARLKALAQETGLNQGQILHLLLNFVDLAVFMGIKQQVLEESLPMSKLERFTVFTAHGFDVLPQQQVEIVKAFARHGSIPKSAMIEAILSLMKTNVESINE